ncbi:MAG: phosphate signaling complex protein PhoU [Actinomycetota bacterium]
MRDHYHEALDAIGADLVEMTRLVGSAMDRATTALIDADLALAESVIAADEQIDRLQKGLEARAFELLALQQPVATDLRVIVTSLRMSADLERMGDLARHVAKLARLKYPESAIPAEFRSTILEMAQVASRIVAKAGSVIAHHDIAGAVELEKDDDEMDRLHRQLFTMLLEPGPQQRIEVAIDLTLCGRFYERFADHAVSVARRVVYLVTGEYAAT